MGPPLPFPSSFLLPLPSLSPVLFPVHIPFLVPLPYPPLSFLPPSLPSPQSSCLGIAVSSPAAVGYPAASEFVSRSAMKLSGGHLATLNSPYLFELTKMLPECKPGYRILQLLQFYYRLSGSTVQHSRVISSYTNDESSLF